ncbi:Os02g0247500, partial [Oryza sativa Japonica Group]
VGGGRGPASVAALGVDLLRALRALAGGRGPDARLHRRPRRPLRALRLPCPRLPLHHMIRRFPGVRRVLQGEPPRACAAGAELVEPLLAAHAPLPAAAICGVKRGRERTERVAGEDGKGDGVAWFQFKKVSVASI